MKNSLVSIIIINWNGLQELKTCLPGLYKQNYKNIEIIIVDNNSHDKSKNYIKKNFPKIILIENNDNYGFAQACNIGVKNAKGKYVLLLNNDTKVTPNFLTILVAFLEKNKNFHIVQPKIIFLKDKKLQSGCSFLTSTGFLYHFGYGKNPNLPIYNQQRDIFSAHGSCMLIQKKVIDAIGLFDDEYFAYVEETDFCWRAHLAGYNIRYIPEALVYHAGAQTSRKLPSEFIMYHSTKNRLQTIIKNATLPTALTMLSWQFIFALLFVGYGLLHGKTTQLISYSRAIFTIIKNRKELQRKRKQITTLQKKSEKEIFQKLCINPRITYYYFLLTGVENYKDTL